MKGEIICDELDVKKIEDKVLIIVGILFFYYLQLLALLLANYINIEAYLIAFRMCFSFNYYDYNY
ncbi:MAG: hypothetical protein L6U99_08955 [Clostridium sp.]|nr:MAG: hypothetical protein L6U99_08955 [Clostridium sp.]